MDSINETLRKAAHLIDAHGPGEARKIAAGRANRYLEERDFEGSAAWKAILDAMNEIVSSQRDPARPLN